MPASARNSIRGLICSHASPPQSHRLCLGEVAKRHACFRKAHHSSTMASLAVKHMLPKRKLLGNIRVYNCQCLTTRAKQHTGVLGTHISNTHVFPVRRCLHNVRFEMPWSASLLKDAPITLQGSRLLLSCAFQVPSATSITCQHITTNN